MSYISISSEDDLGERAYLHGLRVECQGGPHHHASVDIDSILVGVIALAAGKQFV